MIRVETCPPQQPPERNPAIEGFIHWRGKMEEMRTAKRRDMIGVMIFFNHMAEYRRGLAPWEWIWCPQCGGRGMWVDGGNHWCPRCSGTRILLAEELTDPAEIALVRRITPPPDWGRLWSDKTYRLSSTSQDPGRNEDDESTHEGLLIDSDCASFVYDLNVEGRNPHESNRWLDIARRSKFVLVDELDETNLRIPYSDGTVFFYDEDKKKWRF